jgi:hypothetical protein
MLCRTRIGSLFLEYQMTIKKKIFFFTQKNARSRLLLSPPLSMPLSPLLKRDIRRKSRNDLIVYKGNRRKRLYRRTDRKFTLSDKKKRRRRFIKSGYGPRTIQLSSRKTEDITISESKIDGTVYIVRIGLFHKDLSVFLGGRAVCIIWRMVELITSVPTSVF